jgi:hypothetical protein
MTIKRDAYSLTKTLPNKLWENVSSRHGPKTIGVKAFQRSYAEDKSDLANQMGGSTPISWFFEPVGASQHEA